MASNANAPAADRGAAASIGKTVTVENSLNTHAGQVAPRCQGCGAIEGEPIVIVRNRRSAPGEPIHREAVSGPIAEIVTVPRVDYGDRHLCQRCRRGATVKLRALHKAARVVGGRS